jgi:hypothetical protein
MNADPAKFLTRGAREVCGVRSKSRLPGCNELHDVMHSKNLEQLDHNVEYNFHGCARAAPALAPSSSLSSSPRAASPPSGSISRARVAWVGSRPRSRRRDAPTRCVERC